MTTVQSCESQAEWDEQILSRGGHPLQLWGWGEVKALHNWNVDRVFIYEKDQIIGAAQLLIRKLPKPFNALVYVPRGPVAEKGDRGDVLDAIGDYAKAKYHAVAVTIEPDWRTIPHVNGWHKSVNTILIPRTLILDLRKTEDELLAAMAKKTRQYIRKSANDAVEIRQVKKREELAECLAIYKETAARAGFGLHEDQYYYDIFAKMRDHGLVTAAFYEGKPVAFLWLVISERTAFELYGGMNDEGQRLRANYTLKWSTIQMTKNWELERYDFNGLLNDGVSTFKQGFADHEDMLVGTYDRPLSFVYVLWARGLPLAKKIIQKIKNR
jgi:lipid II:glycine glycyltransferase (peptidoglycan interpeptide bridge formation enzyme)